MYLILVLFQARLHAIQLDSGTYCTEPSGPPEKYEEWLQEFDLESKKGDISQLLVAHEEVRALYTQIVCFFIVSHAAASLLSGSFAGAFYCVTC